MELQRQKSVKDSELLNCDLEIDYYVKYVAESRTGVPLLVVDVNMSMYCELLV